ncbi:hypothetical protein [Marinicellulosiphila megalodicopiae]|uniref:hypothetical protein n=1 Tax=Marinicellulosiphila megalodicopiae TaxID=2724896 RepID=UPI003BB10124
MKKMLLGSAMSVLMLASCDGGITYSSCKVKTDSDVANFFIPGGEYCYDVDGGGFLLKSDAEQWCEEQLPSALENLNGTTEVELVYELSRESCSASSDEEE